MRKTHHGTPKRQGGLSLIPALWDEIDRVAETAGVPRNQVIETVLMREFGVPNGSQNVDASSRKAEENEVVTLP